MKAQKSTAQKSIIFTPSQLVQIRKHTISPAAYKINQEIVKALSDALTTYKKERLDASFAKHINLDRDKFQVWVEKHSYLTNCYSIGVRLHNYSQFMLEGAFAADRETSDYYATRLEDSVYVKDHSGEYTNWREKMQFVIDRFNDCDTYEWKNNLVKIYSKLQKLEKKARAIREEALTLIKSCPAPVNDPLGRSQSKQVPFFFKDLFPALFGWNK